MQGKTVQVTTGTWSPVPTNLTYRWERCNENGRTCAAIPNATGTSYTVTSADVGHALLAVVRAANGTTVQNAFSTATPEVVPASVKGPTVTIGPVVNGFSGVGQQLVASPGIWTGVGPTTFSYRWYRCDASGGALRARPELHVEPVHDGREGRRHDDRGDGQGDRRGRLVARLRKPRGPCRGGERRPVADERADHLRNRARRRGAQRRMGILVARAERIQDDVAALQRERAALQRRSPERRGATYKPSAADAGHTLVAAVVATAGAVTQTALTAATAPIT